MDVVETYIGPLSVDANNDGIYEVFATGQGKVVGLNGLTGERLWEYTNAEITLHSPFDIHDLNNDGIPELVVASSHRTIALHTNNGSEYWNAPVESGDHHLIILDTDGTKYPYVYVTSADIAHLYNGSGRLRKLRGTDGAIMAEAFSWKPCWGGLSAADANNDGKFEIYANDRSAGYSPPNLAKGLQAYDADTLELLWYHNEPLASSHVMSIIDVNGDGTLDAIGLNQASNGGVCVIDGATGMKMPGKCSMSLNVSLGSHSPFPVYDIDNDGNLEIISARETIAVVWDIGAWKMDGILNRFIEPPRIEDVIGDGKFEIVGAVGDVWIYNSSYSLIEKISGADFIASTIVQDIDNDDQNELIGISSTGVVKVYETSAYAPTPRVRTNNLYYSERHLGVGMYVPPPGAPQPIIKEAYPADTAINVDFNPKLSARVVDFRYDKMDIEISTNASGSWETVATFSDVENGWYNFTPTNMNEGDTNYYWRVTAVDPHADNLVTTQTFSFTTKPKASQMPGWDYKKRITIDHTKVTSNLTNFPVLIEFTDADVAGNAQSGGEDILFTGSDGSTKLAHEIESYDSGSGHLVAWVNVPSLSSTTDTVLYMYYGNPTAEDQQNAGSVWDGNYLGVYHLKEKAGSVIGDSTNKYDGIPTNVTLDAAGKIDGADQFNGIRNTGTNLSKVFTNQNRFTVEGWIYVTNGAKQGYMASQRDWSQRGMLIQYSPSGTLQLYVDGRITPSKPLGGTYSWHYVVGTYDGITARLYRDDTTVASASASTITWPNVSTYIGNRGDTLDRTFAGMIDEVRISNIARSEAYIMTSYSNQNDPASFITVGAAETAADSTKPAVLNAFPAHLSKDVPFDIAEISFDLYDAQSDLMDYTITSYPDIGLDVVQQVSNGRYALSVAGLEPDTEYSWTVDVTDGAETNHKEFTFRTIKGYVLNLSASGSGAIVMSNPGAPYYAAGSEIELTAVPAPGWVFAGWNGVVSWTEAILGNDNPKKINMESNASVTAIFRPVGVPLLADSTFDASIDSVDLRANSLAQDWWESRGNASNGDSTLVTLDTANVGGNTGKKAKLAESTTKNAYLTQEFLVPQTSRFSLEWNVYVDTILPYPGSVGAAQQIIGYDSGSSSGPNAGKRFVMMAFYRPGGSTAQNATMSLIAQELGDTSSSGDWRVIASDLFMDRWYKIRVDVDLPGEKYDVYVNDVLRANDVQASSWLLNLTHISFATWNDGRGTFYVDNVNEYTIP